MSYQHIRRQAEELVEAAAIKKLPVDVERVAKHLGLNVVHAELGKDTSGLLVVQGPEDVRICINKEDPPTRRRFSTAHEIGHWVLKHHTKPGVHVDRGHVVLARDHRSLQGAWWSAILDKTEVEANQFASALLMPERMLKEAVATSANPLRDVDITDLAKVFQVSEQAMTIRLTRLGLLEV